MIKHTDESIQSKIDKLATLPVHSKEAQLLRHKVCHLLIEDSAKPKESGLSMVFSELMATI